MKKTRLAVGALVALGLGASPLQAQTFPTNDPVIQSMWQEGMEGSQVFELSQALLDSIGPRLMGSPGFDAAADWLLSRYASWGIEAEKQEYGTWCGWERGYSHIDLISPRVRTLSGMMLAWSPGTDGPIEGEVIARPLFSSPAEFEAWLPNVEGKIVATTFAEPTCREDQSWLDHATPEAFETMTEERNQGRQAFVMSTRAMGQGSVRRMEEAGAIALLSSRWSAGWGVDKIFSSPTSEVPGVHLSCEDYGLVWRLAERGQSPRIRIDAQAEFLGDVPAFNVVGRIPGTELPDEYVLLSAHLDSWDGASGATDNGTGTIMMVEAMRILKAAYPNPRRTIVVGHWGGEEQGLIGSTAFAADNSRGNRRPAGRVQPGQRDLEDRLHPHDGLHGRGCSLRPLVLGDSHRDHRPHRARHPRGAGDRRKRPHVLHLQASARVPLPVQLPGLPPVHMAHEPRHLRQDRLRRAAQ